MDDELKDKCNRIAERLAKAAAMICEEHGFPVCGIVLEVAQRKTALFLGSHGVIDRDGVGEFCERTAQCMAEAAQKIKDGTLNPEKLNDEMLMIQGSMKLPKKEPLTRFQPPDIDWKQFDN